MCFSWILLHPGSLQGLPLSSRQMKQDCILFHPEHLISPIDSPQDTHAALAESPMWHHASVCKLALIAKPALLGQGNLLWSSRCSTITDMQFLNIAAALAAPIATAPEEPCQIAM